MDIDAVANYFGIHSLHFEQRRAVSHFLNGKDVFIVLPTGFGKSFCSTKDLDNNIDKRSLKDWLNKL